MVVPALKELPDGWDTLLMFTVLQLSCGVGLVQLTIAVQFTVVVWFKLAGQVIVGGVTSASDTVKLHVAVLLQISVAV